MFHVIELITSSHIGSFLSALADAGSAWANIVDSSPRFTPEQTRDVAEILFVLPTAEIRSSIFQVLCATCFDNMLLN